MGVHSLWQHYFQWKYDFNFSRPEWQFFILGKLWQTCGGKGSKSKHRGKKVDVVYGRTQSCRLHIKRRWINPTMIFNSFSQNFSIISHQLRYCDTQTLQSWTFVSEKKIKVLIIFRKFIFCTTFYRKIWQHYSTLQ